MTISCSSKANSFFCLWRLCKRVDVMSMSDTSQALPSNCSTFSLKMPSHTSDTLPAMTFTSLVIGTWLNLIDIYCCKAGMQFRMTWKQISLVGKSSLSLPRDRLWLIWNTIYFNYRPHPWHKGNFGCNPENTTSCVADGGPNWTTKWISWPFVGR